MTNISNWKKKKKIIINHIDVQVPLSNNLNFIINQNLLGQQIGKKKKKKAYSFANSNLRANL